MQQMYRLSIVFIIIFLMSNAQDKSYPEIDSLYIKVYNSSHESGNFQKGLIEIRELISESKKSKYRLGIIRGYIYAGNFSSTINRHQDALKYFELAEQELKSVKDFSLEAELHIEFGKIYHFMGLYQASDQHYNKGIRASKQINDVAEKESGLAYAYACKADNLVSMNAVDFVKIYFQKAFKIEPDAITASNIAYSFIRYNPEEIDSAAHYLKIGEKLAANSSVYQKYAVLKVSGDFYYPKKEFSLQMNLTKKEYTLTLFQKV